MGNERQMMPSHVAEHAAHRPIWAAMLPVTSALCELSISKAKYNFAFAQ
jgi:hypothetical protein